LRSRFQVSLVSAEQIPFSEFLMRIPEISYAASVRLEPLGALSVMQIDLGLSPPMIDLLLGGEGEEGPLRELTDIEESILASVVEIICHELTAAWQPVGLSFNFERRQMQTQVARIMSVNEKTLCLSFEIRMPHGSGLLNLAFPAVVANTILRRLTSDWGRRRRHAPETRARMEAAVRQIRFGGALQLPALRIQANAIRGLEVGTILRLDLSANTHAEWRVGGQHLVDAQAIRKGTHRAARIGASPEGGNA
jgi:flagellar motor switch protein FliM